MSDFNQRPAAASNALKDSKLKLIGMPHEKAAVYNGTPKAPTLAWAIKDNQPRCIVYTNVEGDKQDGRIEAAMDAPTFAAIMEAIRIYASGEDIEGKQFVDFPCIGYLWTRNGKSEKPMILSTVFVGRDRDGYTFISAQSSDSSRPKIKFSITPTEWHGVTSNGAVLDNKTIGRLYGKGYANLVESLMTQLLVKEHISWEEMRDRKAKNQQGGGNGQSGGNNFNRGNNRGGFNGGSGQQQRSNNAPSNPAPAEGGFDDDIPF